MAVHGEFERAIFYGVDESRLWVRMMEMAAIGRVGETGVNRPAFSDEDARARRLLYQWGMKQGLVAHQDAVGNLFLRYEGTRPQLPAVLAGSHLDSQPMGGRFDGTYGVLAALEAITVFRELGIQLERSLEVVAWSNEEGSRFAPGAMGSQVFSGTLGIAEVLSVRDASGTTVQEAARRTIEMLPEASLRAAHQPPAAYLEAHIEQGPILERQDAPVGVVTGIQGCAWLEIEVVGEAAHAGTVPEEFRRDALVAAIQLIESLRRECLSLSSDCRFTVGRMNVRPNSSNTIPGSVVFTIDLRHPDTETFANLLRRLRAASIPRPFALTIRELFRHQPESFRPEIVNTIEDVAASVRRPAVRLVSGAFHDALFVARCCPVGMIFVRCRNGVSHNPGEYAQSADLADGARVLAVALYRLARL